MQLRMFSLLTILFLNTNQILTMDLLNNVSMMLFGSSWNKSTAKKGVVPLVVFPYATDEEKELIQKCNGLKLDLPSYTQATHRHQFLAFLEKKATTITLPEAQLKEYLKKERPTLQKKFNEMVDSLFADRTANVLIEFYIGVRPQLVKNGTEKEYFKKRLDLYNKKVQDLRALEPEQTILAPLHYINGVVNCENKKEEETYAFLKSDSFKETYGKPQGIDDAIPKFLGIQKKYPNYTSRKTFIENKNKSLSRLHLTIYNRTGFEPYFIELCCCASDTPTEVLQIINDYIICSF
jgi:hypothetical protein